MYKYTDKEHKTVTNLTTGQSGIHPGVWMWESYQAWLDAGGITEAFDTRTQEEKEEAEKKEQEIAIRAKYDSMLNAAVGSYTAGERETWKTQEEEAKQYKADPNAECLMIKAMAAARGISVDLLADKILSNADLFRQASGQIIGLQQAELDLLYPEKINEI